MKKIILVVLLFAIILGLLIMCDFDVKSLVEKLNNSHEASEVSTTNQGITQTSVTNGNSKTTTHSHKDNIDDIEDGELQFHFLELGNKYTGDSTFIKAGELDILVDAGSRKSSAKSIVDHINEYCEDGVLEYVIATHAHQDHIAAFVGNSTNKGIFEEFEIETIIDFGLTNSESSIYNEYVELREQEIALGANYYTQNECYYNLNNAQRTYQLTDNITMSILYNYYGEFGDSKTDENDFSVCLLFTQESNNYLLTGDLEAKGEEKLVENNNLPQVKLFKAGHHGSYTASTEELLSTIRPEIVTVCCCAGSSEYTDNTDNMFPSQAFIDRVGIYTDKIYVTTLCIDYASGNYESLNGTIIVSSNGGNVIVSCLNNNCILKETDWFKENRVWPN